MRRRAVGAVGLGLLGAAVAAGVLTITVTRRRELRMETGDDAVPVAVLALHGLFAALALAIAAATSALIAL